MGYLFDPAVLHEIARRAVGKPFDEMTRFVIGEVAAAYPGHTATREDWLFNITAGATGVMTVLHASLSEYVLLFGTACGTEGYSGRYRVAIYDAVLSGEMWTYTEDDVGRKVVSRPGDLAVLGRDQVKGFVLKDGTWLLEYGRGPIPTVLPLALGDSIFSAMDFHTVWKTLRIYGTMVARELLRGKI